MEAEVRERDIKMICYAIEGGRGRRAKEPRGPVEAGEGKGIYSPPQPPVGMQSCGYLDLETSDVQNYKMIKLH